MREQLFRYKWYVFATVLALLFCFLYFFRLPFCNVAAIDAIPTSSGIVIDVPRLALMQKQLDTTAYKNVLGQITLAEKCNSDLTNLKRIFDKNLLSEDMRLVAGAEESNFQTIDFVYVIDTKWRQVHLRPTLESLQGVKVTTYNYQGTEVYNLVLWNNFAFSFASYRNLIIGARYSTLVEDALQAVASKNAVGNDAKFTKISDDLDGKYDMNLYFNMAATPKMLASFLTPEKKEDFVTLSKSVAWIGSGLTFSKEGIAIKGGISLAQDNAFTYALRQDNYHDREAVAQVLPTNTAMMTWIGTGDFKNFNAMMGGDYVFTYYFAPWLGEEFAYVVSEPHSAEKNSDVYVVFKVKDRKLAIEKMQGLDEKEGILLMYDYNTFKIKQLRSENIFNGILGETGKTLENPYYAYAGEYMVFCNSRAGIEVFMDKYMVGQTLANDLAYQDFLKKQTDKSNLFFYLNASYLGEMLQKSVHEGVSQQLSEQFEQVSKMNLMGINLRARPGGFDFTGNLKWNAKKKTKTASASVAWKTLLDADAVTQPTVMVNPTTEEPEIFVQDAANQIYIINAGGEILKKKRIDGRILGEVKQIEYFGNSKLCYIFNTENKIYILDEKGADVQNFPILLQSPAESGMLVVDFDNSKKYQYFIPAKNGNIYGFERNGKPVAGWNPRMGVGTIKVPMRHFQTEGKDFIVAINSKNQVYTFKRNGDLRFSVAAEGEVLSAPGFQPNPPERIVVTNANGFAQNINFAGETFKLALKTGTGNKHKFIYTDVTGDGKNEYIVLNNNVLACYGYDGETFRKFFEHKFQDTIDDIFSIDFPKKEKHYIGLTCKASAHVFLMDGIGKMYKEFPLGGSTPFTLCNFLGEDITTLIVANGASVYTYKLK